MNADFSILEKRIGVIFSNKDLLRQSMVHRSFLNENPSFSLNHNERLEYLGDAVLELVVTDYLYKTFPDADEGTMTNWRASLVNSKMLSLVSRNLNLDEFLYLSKGEGKDSESKARQYILANAIEALIGAVYLEKGYEEVDKFIHTFVLPHLPLILEQGLDVDPKSRFQELAQEKLKVTPRYDVLKMEGPDHAKWFTVGVYLDKELIATGEGSSKQEAQLDAAKQALCKKEWNGHDQVVEHTK